MGESDDTIRLPVVNQNEETEAAAASCDPKIYVSLEEKTILEAMRNLRSRAQELRTRLETASGKTRDDLEAELNVLRKDRSELQARREEAYKRKMIMLGHLPAEDVDLL